MAPGFEPQIDAEITFGGESLHFDPDEGHVRINLQGIVTSVSYRKQRFRSAR